MTVKSLEDLKVFLKKEILPHMQNKTVILLSGTLGAGKTQFVKSYGELVGVSGVSSPTFAIIQEYAFGETGFCHVDLYRIERPEELENIGFWEVFETQNLIFIEWPEKLEVSRIPRDWKKLNIQISAKGDDREITVI
jgi:tRNA threonylcarbamoyladenosine biosynthesis protein TsaE